MRTAESLKLTNACSKYSKYRAGRPCFSLLWKKQTRLTSVSPLCPSFKYQQPDPTDRSLNSIYSSKIHLRIGMSLISSPIWDVVTWRVGVADSYSSSSGWYVTLSSAFFCACKHGLHHYIKTDGNRFSSLFADINSLEGQRELLADSFLWSQLFLGDRSDFVRNW